jgi:ketosteroid isomerase-like protein
MGATSFGQPGEKEEPENLKQVFQQQTEQWREAYNSKDAQNLVPFYSEDASYISSHVEGLEANGRDQLIANFQRGMSGGGHIDSIEIMKMDVSCDQATLLTKYHANNSGQIVVGRNLLVMRKIDGRWLIVLHMTVV